VTGYRRTRAADDFRLSVLQAFHEVVREVEAVHGPARLLIEPQWVETDSGSVRRASATWFLPVGGAMINHHIRVDETGRPAIGHAPEVARRWIVYTSRHQGDILHAEVTFTVPPVRDVLRSMAALVGLLPMEPPAADVIRLDAYRAR
jgi:hypothetical protein